MRELKTERIYEVPKKGIKSVIDDPTQPLYTNDGEREERRSVNGSAAHNGGLTRLLPLFLGATAGRTERTQEMERAGAISKCQEGEDERGEDAWHGKPARQRPKCHAAKVEFTRNARNVGQCYSFCILLAGASTNM